MELYNNLRILRKHAWLIGLTTLVALLSALAYDRLHHNHTVYMATSTLILNPAVSNRAWNFTSSSANAQSSASGSSSTAIELQTLATTYDGYITSQPFLETVVKNHHLAMSATDLANAITTQQIAGSLFYKISVTGSNQQQVYDAAAALASGFIEADAQSAQLHAQQAAQNATLPGAQSSINIKLEAANVKFWGERIADLQRQLLAVETNTRMTPDQKYTRVVNLQSALADAMANQSKGLTPVTQAQQAAEISAAYNDGTSLPEVVSRSALVKNLVLFAALGGFILGLALALLREYLDSSLRNADDVEEVLARPVLATVSQFGTPRLRQLWTKQERAPAARQTIATVSGVNNKLVTLTDPFHSASEACRSLRTSIIFAGAVQRVRTLVISSAVPGEGKSVLAANLAIVMAQAGERVILVDADMRRPVLHTLLGIPARSGLSNLYLTDEANLRADVAASLQATVVPNLRVLDAGFAAPNPAELLASGRTARLIDALRDQADLIIFDTPAMGLLTDAVVLASHADATVLVVRAHATRRDLPKAALTRLSTVNARILGVVLNMTDEPGSRYTRYYQRAQRAMGKNRVKGQTTLEEDFSSARSAVANPSTVAHDRLALTPRKTPGDTIPLATAGTPSSGPAGKRDVAAQPDPLAPGQTDTPQSIRRPRV